MQKEHSHMQTTSLDNFSLNWRWTSPEHCLLTSDELTLITPVDAASAKTLWEKSLNFSSKNYEFSPNSEIFTDIESIRSTDFNKTSKWLKQKIPHGKIIISWSSNTAVITDAELFVKYWSEFCYPSSDDVTVWSETEDWFIHYCHYELFWYGGAKCI